MHFFCEHCPILLFVYSICIVFICFSNVFLSEICIFPCLFAICWMNCQIAVDERSFSGGYAKNQSVILSLNRHFLCLFACSASLV